MNSRRSYLDSMNAGRRRRSTTSLEQLNRTLDELEGRISGGREGLPPHAGSGRDDDERGWRVPDYGHEAPGREAERARGASRQGGGDHAALARDIERMRGQEDSLHSIGRIAGELRGLREELRHDVGGNLREEFAALRADIDRAMNVARPPAQLAELSSEFDRLAAMIHELGGRGDERQVEALRHELKEVKNALSQVAREETVRSVDRRWEDIAGRLGHGAPQDAAETPAMEALSARLEQISEAVNRLPTSVAMRSLEDKLKVLATAVDQFAHQQDRLGPEALDAIEERLDEITRAIAATGAQAAVRPPDAEAFERIEARISSLARQLDELAEDRQGDGAVQRIAELTERVEEVARQARIPEQVVDRLTAQIDQIAQRLDSAPNAPDLAPFLHDMDNRFNHLADMLERRHGDAMEQGRSLFVELERRLEEVSGRIAGPESSPDLSVEVERRLAEILARLDERADGVRDDGAMRGLEARLEDISARLEQTAGQAATGNRELIESLEAQIATLSQHLRRPLEMPPELEDIRPRLDEIERAVRRGQEDLVEAARMAAEEAMARHSGRNGPELEHVNSLAEDLKSLEALSRRSDDRNARTFEAIHDTLLKIVDRLGTLEAPGPQRAAPDHEASERSHSLDRHDTPPIQADFDQPLPDLPEGTEEGEAGQAVDPEPRHGETDETAPRTPASAARRAAAAARSADTDAAGETKSEKRSFLGGLGRAISPRKAARTQAQDKPASVAAPAAPAREEASAPALDEPLDPGLANQPIEPGSGTPDLNAIMRRVRDERSQGGSSGAEAPDAAKSDFIAAARRAAQAAAAEADMLKKKPSKGAGEGRFAIGGLLKGRTRTLTLGVAMLALVVGGLQLGPRLTSSDEQREVASAQGAASSQPAAPNVEESPTLVTAALDAALSEREPEVAAPRDTAEAVPAAFDAGDEIAREADGFESEQAGGADGADWLQDASSPTETSPAAIEPETEPQDDAVTGSVMPSQMMDGTVAAEAGFEPAGPVEFEVPEEAGPAPLRAAARDGDPKALFELGNRYAEGRGVDADMEAAAGWYELSADLGLAPAQYRIANLYEKGNGVARDIGKAREWYRRAAEGGNASAMHNLAVLHAMGPEGDVDNEAAAHWFQEAADLGVRDSQFNLAILSAKGVGMKQDLAEAYKWFDLIARDGDEDAAAKRDEVAAALEPEQLERARDTAELWEARPVDAEANVVEIPDEWMEDDMPTASIDERGIIRNIQTILNANGFDAGAADGIMGARTQAAIARFQEANGMEATGAVDEALVEALLEQRPQG